uniref:Helicase ATP-binding domain-containing protein n=1 Tax=Timema monikensis TaxID=170555 RepID=A0A7R9EGP6_9NEOP|nr:unnamed protein product [Timema monikensis]
MGYPRTGDLHPVSCFLVETPNRATTHHCNLVLSRLDRLFVLLETGSSPVTRRAAAQQLGEVQKLHPHELHNLLSRITTYLHSPSWETRIAAGQAVEAVLRHVPQWDPVGSPVKTESYSASVALSQVGRMNFQKFSMSNVLANSSHLMGSEGKEFDMEEDVAEEVYHMCIDREIQRARYTMWPMKGFHIARFSGRTVKAITLSINQIADDGEIVVQSQAGELQAIFPKGVDIREKMARQRQQLNARLGLDTAARIGLDDMSDILEAEDFAIAPEFQRSRSVESARRPVSEVVLQEGGLSSREMNRARRKARQAVLKQRSREGGGAAGEETGVAEEPDKKRVKTEDSKAFVEGTAAGYGDSVPDSTGSWGEAVEWPFESFCDRLCQDLFSLSWEVRHGAATALREVIRLHGAGAGKSANIPKTEMDEFHQLWLEDVALRLLCVLALDRFGDFVSDQVVAPVRETCAQALGSVLHLMCRESVDGVLRVLVQLLNQREWEARHGGLLGLKYLLAVREDLVRQLLPAAFPHILEGLSDPVDDVGAVAASALIPVAPNVVTELPGQVEATVQRLWDLLLDQDELAAACNSFMGLLAALLSLPDTHLHITKGRIEKVPFIWLSSATCHIEERTNCYSFPLRRQPLCEVVPRLWPFLSHSTSSVRRATLQTLHTLTNQESAAGKRDCGDQWTPPLLQDALRHIFQRTLVEPLTEIQDLAEKVWGNLIRYSSLQELLLASCPFVSTWLCLTMQPAKLVIDPALLIHSKTSLRERFGERSTRRPRAFASLESNCGNSGGVEGGITGAGAGLKCEQKLYLGGSETTPLATRESNVMRARCMASRMLGLLSCYIVQPAPGIVYSPDVESPVDSFVKVLLVYLNSKSALQRMVVGLVIAEWARLDTLTPACPETLKVETLYQNIYLHLETLSLSTNQDLNPNLPVIGILCRLHQCLSECVYFDEIAVSFTKLLQEAKDFVAMLKHYKLPLDCAGYDGTSVLTLDQIQQLSGPMAQRLLSAHRLKPRAGETLEERRKAIQSAVSETSSNHLLLNISTQAALAGAVTMLRILPDKLNPVVKPLMESVKREDNEQLQELAAEHLARLVELCVDRNPCPNAKIVSNLCTFLCCDHEYTPKIQFAAGKWKAQLLYLACSFVRSLPPGVCRQEVESTVAISDMFVCLQFAAGEGDSGVESTGDNSRTGTPTGFNTDNYTGILTLTNQQRSAERAVLRRSNSTGGRGPGRPPLTDIPLEELFAVEDSMAKLNKIQRRGAAFALTAITAHFASNLHRRLPKLWEVMIVQLSETVDFATFDPSLLVNNDQGAEDLVSSLQVLEATCPALHSDLLGQVQNYVSINCLGERAENYSQYTRLGLDPDPSVIGSTVFCESSALEHSTTEAGLTPLILYSLSGSQTTNSLNLNRWLTLESYFLSPHTLIMNCFQPIFASEKESFSKLRLGVFVVSLPPRVTGASHWSWQVLQYLPRMCLLLTHPYRAVRHMAARCLGALAALSSVPVMTHVVDQVLPLLGTIDSDINRQGAVEALACIIEHLKFGVVPYIVLLVVPLLGRMSDQNQPVRLMATHCFATLIQLMPLDGGVPDPPNLTSQLAQHKARERRFLEQLFNPKSIENYKVPVSIRAELRCYQQSGVNWLAFLNKYKLHGILCDDMGLGKTLQSICILAGDHFYRHQHYLKTRSPDCVPLPSIVICPPTLTGHWVYEVNKFLPEQFLYPLQYVGPPAERDKMRSLVGQHNLVVASYDIVRKDIDFFSSIKWNYCILDEGHVIKNGKTKVN